MGASEIVDLAKLAFELGLAVYQAVQAGEDHRTVREIFDGVKRDREELDALREKAKAKFGEGQ